MFLKKELREAYERFNTRIRRADESLTKDFFNSLKKKGYSGIMDFNDQQQSGYNSRKPMIFFDAKDKVSIIKTTNLDKISIDRIKEENKIFKESQMEELLDNAAAYSFAPIAGGTFTAFTYIGKKESKINSKNNHRRS